MKNFFLVILVSLSFSALAQSDTALRPYQRFPTLPPLQILLPDSATLYGKAQIPPKTPVLYMLFDPGCSHCQHETEQLVAHKEDLRDIQIVMITMPRVLFSDVKDFIEKYKVNELRNVVVGKDVFYFMPSFYTLHNFPFMALYNKEGRLITTLEGSVGIERIVDMFKAGQGK